MCNIYKKNKTKQQINDTPLNLCLSISLYTTLSIHQIMSKFQLTENVKLHLPLKSPKPPNKFKVCVKKRVKDHTLSKGSRVSCIHSSSGFNSSKQAKLN